MCLNYKYSNKRKKNFVKDIPKEGLKVYKVVRINEKGAFSSPCFVSEYQPGINVDEKECTIDNGTGLRYKSGFHFFKIKKQAKVMLKWCLEECDSKYELIECIVKKSWITDVGEENRWGYMDKKEKYQVTIIVANKAIFPEKKTE